MTYKLVVCIKQRSSSSASCAGRGSLELLQQLEQTLKRRGLNVEVEKVHCLGRCTQGPNMRIAPGKDFFHGVTPKDVDAIIDQLVSYNAEDPASGTCQTT